jgi:hypothetical protein
LISEKPYTAYMRGAFVVRLAPQTDTAREQFEGSVEEVDTGKRLKFRSTEELLRFMGQRFEEALRATAKSINSKENDTDVS